MSEAKVIIDETQLNALRELDQDNPDSNIISDLIDLFILHTPETQKELRVSIDHENRERVKKMAHKLKGSCANLGAESMRVLACDLEQRADDIAWADAAKLEIAIGIAYEELVEILNRDWRKKPTSDSEST